MKEPGNDRGYARAVESALARLAGRSTLLSPRDFALLARWRAKGVPLGVVLEALEASSRRGGLAPRSALARVAPSVEESWQAIREARAPSLPGSRSIGLHPASARNRWREALERTADGSPLRSLLARLVARLEAGDDPAVIDLDLDRDLVAAVPDELRARARADVETRRAAVRARIRTEAEGSAIERATVNALRVRLDLPRLAESSPTH